MSAMRHRVKFVADSSPDGVVDPDYTGTALLSGVPWLIVPARGMEKYRGRQLEATTDYVIETRHYPNVLPNMVAVNELDSTQYLIKSIVPDPMLRMMVIEATERVV